ncbi:MAG: radical SAM protein [Muribaculaceae bacterium]|nr:radical SAM protein [Muribaculaceae bacterium]
MKYSKYNIPISVSKDTDIIYNSLSDKYVFLKKGLLEASLRNNNNSCYNNLKKGGFIVDDNTDETQLCLEKARQIECDETSAHLIINPTINCNFRCWYCYEKHVPSKMSEATIDNIKRLIVKSCRKAENLTISFFGGEPLIYYDDVMLPIIKYAKKIALENGVNFTTNCTTNGSLFNKTRIAELKELNFNFAQITLDGNRDVHNKTRCYASGKGSYDKIIENIKELARNHVSVTLRINYTKENIHSIADIPTDFSDIPDDERRFINVSFHKVWQEGELESNEIEKSISAFIEAGFVASKFVLGSYCYGDLRNSAVINYNGDVYKCTAVNFEEEKRDGYLDSNGDIIWENNSLEKRMAAKFSNKPCLECNLLPICHGGCSSKPLENGCNYCIFGFNEEKKMNAVMNKFLYNIIFKWKSMLHKT